MGKSMLQKSGGGNAKKSKCNDAPLRRPASSHTITKSIVKTSTYRTRQMEPIDLLLQKEIKVWGSQIARHKGKVGESVCPLCIRLFTVKRQALAHTAVHISGRSAGLGQGSDPMGRSSHPAQVDVIRALYSHDVLRGQEQGNYSKRCTDLMTQWVDCKPTGVGGASSIHC